MSAAPPAAAATPAQAAPPRKPSGSGERAEDLRDLAAPMSELAAVQLDVAATEAKCRKLQSLLRAGEREMAKLQAAIDDARAAVGGGGSGTPQGSGRAAPKGGRRRDALGAEDDSGGAAAAAAEAARRAAAGIWREVATLDARIAVMLHALGEVERLRLEAVGDSGGGA